MRRTVKITAAAALVAIASYAVLGPENVLSRAPNGPPAVYFNGEISEGNVDVMIEQTADLTVNIEVKLSASAYTINFLQLEPEANLAMVDMHMDGISPNFSQVEVGLWRAKAVVPMVGTWVINIGFGEEFIETSIVVR